MQERPELSQLRSEEQDARIDRLLARIEELERQLGLNSGNSGNPPSRDGDGNKSRVTNPREKTGKRSGGQEGPTGQTLEQTDSPDKGVDHCPTACAGCGEAVGLEQPTGYKKRQVFDVPQPQLREVTEPRAPRCYCPKCGPETAAAFPDEVAALVQFGSTLERFVVYFSGVPFLPEDRVVAVVGDIFGVPVSAIYI